jgi:hypothetical protein
VIGQDLKSLGLVGERENGRLTYAAFTSRLRPKPLALVTRGRTSAGKSTLFTVAGPLIPKDEKIDAMQLTEASLFNGSEDFLTHKILISGERKHAKDDATRDGNRMIRQLVSEGRITRSVSVPCGKRWITEVQERTGPVAYCESTTAGTIFDEDLNRLVQLYVDESEDQTRQVMLARAASYDPQRAPADIKNIVKRHHEYQEWLKDREVPRIVIPYHQELALAIPATKTMCRRVIDQVLTVIETITPCTSTNATARKAAPWWPP